jgi:SpoVK/Ycf46/Vps4 family AAA+-type ATPase
MLAKALARESGSVFLNVLPSHIQSKWFGDTQKYVSAIFSLARKLQPCIVFIDEVDAVLGKRRANEHEVTVSMKTEFMQLWDGLTTGRNDRILIFGATNRPDNLDDAVLRRFVVQYEVGKPGTAQRADILKVILQRYHREEPAGVEARLLNNHVEVDGKRPLDKLAEKTKDFSGADLYNMCCTAASDAAHDAADEVGQPTTIQAPTLTFEMLMKTARATRPSNAAATEYGHRSGVSDQRQSLIDLVDVVWSVQQVATQLGVHNMHAQRAAQFGNGTGMNGHADFNTYDPNAPEDDGNNGNEEDGDNNHI